MFLSNIRENAGLQSAGLLVLDGGQIKRDTWTSGFEDIIASLDDPTSIDDTPVVEQPDLIPGAPVNIPDPNLRRVISDALGVESIRVADMEKLTVLRAKEKNITDLTGIETAGNLKEAWLHGNPIKDLSPIAKCTNLTHLRFTEVPSISALTNLTKLEWLWFHPPDDVRDLSLLANLTNLKDLVIYGGTIDDISPIANLLKLKELHVRHNDVVDISPIANLKELEELDLHNNEISDITPLSSLTKLEKLVLSDNRIENLSPIAQLTKLEELFIHQNGIVDLSPLAGLTNLRVLGARHNKIVDLSPISHIIPNLEHANFSGNIGIRGEGGPKIEGPWLWVYFDNTILSETEDILAQKSNGKITEIKVATNGATEGNKVGNQTWEAHKIPTTGEEEILERNIDAMLGRHVGDGALYGVVDLYSPSEQETKLFFAATHATEVEHALKIWLNGEMILLAAPDSVRNFHGLDYKDAIPATLKAGRNILMVAVGTSRIWWSNLFVGFEAGAKYSLVPPGISYTFPESDIRVGDTFDIGVRVEEMLGLERLAVRRGVRSECIASRRHNRRRLLEKRRRQRILSERAYRSDGTIAGVSGARFDDGGISGSGVIATIRFKAIAEGDTAVTLNNHLFGTAGGESIVVTPDPIRISVAERSMPADVNRDGVVNIFDLIRGRTKVGTARRGRFCIRRQRRPRRQHLRPDSGRQQSRRRRGTAGAWFRRYHYRGVDRRSTPCRRRLARFPAGHGESGIVAGVDDPDRDAATTQLSESLQSRDLAAVPVGRAGGVSMSIYDLDGTANAQVRFRASIGGAYQSRGRAVYWDGRNDRGEPVVSGVYFYTLQAGGIAATRKMLAFCNKVEYT